MWMNSVHTQPDVEHSIVHDITSWLSNDATNLVIDDTIDPIVLNVCKYQVLLGWKLSYMVTSKRLIIYQQDHYLEISSRKLGTTWGVQYIKKLWAIAQQLRCQSLES